MPVQIERDPELTRSALGTWLGASVTLLEGHTTTGYSNETLLFDASFGDGHVEQLVARVQPTQNTVFLEPDFEAEYKVMSLARERGVRVPRLLGYEPDASLLGAPFFVAERVDGLVPPDNPPYTFGGWLRDSTAEEQARLWRSGLEAMIEVHRVPVDGFDFIRRPRFGAAGVEEQLGYLAALYEWIGDPVPAADAGLAWLRANMPEDGPLTLCWGDSRIGNQIFREFSVVAVLDWEMAAIADPEMDVAWFSYLDRVFSEGLGMPRLPGLPTRDETNAMYSDLTGRPVKNARYYEVFSAFRFGIVMIRLGNLMIGSGRLPADSDFATNNFALDTLARVLEQAR